MRIRREKKGKEIIVNMMCDIESSDRNSDELQVIDLMENYAIPLSISAFEKIFRCIVKDFQKDNKKNKTYSFCIICTDISPDD